MADTGQSIGALDLAGALNDDDMLEIERPDGDPEADPPRPNTGWRTSVGELAAKISGGARTGDMLLTVRVPEGGWLEQGAVYSQAAYPELFALVGLVPDGPPGATSSAIPGGTGRAIADYTNVSGSEIVGVGNNTIVRSSNAGLSFAATTTTWNLTTVQALASGVYASGPSTLVRSIDRGLTFQAVALPSGFGTTAATLYQSGGRLFITNRTANSWFSDDFGATWTRHGSNNTGYASFLPLGNGVVLAFRTNSTEAFRSEDNGDTFASITLPANGPAGGWRGVAFGNGVGVIGGNGRILRTTDYGKTWTSILTAAGEPLLLRSGERLFVLSTDGLRYSDSMGASYVGPSALTHSRIAYFAAAGLVLPAANGSTAVLLPYRYDYDPQTMFRTPAAADVRGYIKS